MSNVFIAFLVAVSGGVWLYNKIMRRTGGNTTNSLVVTGFAAVLAFLILLFLLNLIPEA